MHGLVVVKLLNPNIGVGLWVITTVRGNTKGWLSDLIVGDIEWHARSLIINNKRVLLTDVVTDKDLSGVDATVAGVLVGVGAAMAASLLGVLPGVGGAFGGENRTKVNEERLKGDASFVIMTKKEII
jgi:hypothetical protein